VQNLWTSHNKELSSYCACAPNVFLQGVGLSLKPSSENSLANTPGSMINKHYFPKGPNPNSDTNSSKHHFVEWHEMGASIDGARVDKAKRAMLSATHQRKGMAKNNR